MRSRVVFADRKVMESFEKLSEGKTTTGNLLKWLNNAFDRLSEDAFCGIQVPKRQIPKKYFDSFGIENLWKFNLPESWRLLYSVARDEVIVISIVL